MRTVVERLSLVADLRRALDAFDVLTERQRYVVVETYLHERLLADVAAELGVTESAVCHLRKAALGLLRARLSA